MFFPEVREHFVFGEPVPGRHSIPTASYAAGVGCNLETVCPTFFSEVREHFVFSGPEGPPPGTQPDQP